MADWPRQIQGHLIDRGLVVSSEAVEYRYHCVKCGRRVPDPESPGLEREPCVPRPHATEGI